MAESISSLQHKYTIYFIKFMYLAIKGAADIVAFLYILNYIKGDEQLSSKILAISVLILFIILPYNLLLYFIKRYSKFENNRSQLRGEINSMSVSSHENFSFQQHIKYLEKIRIKQYNLYKDTKKYQRIAGIVCICFFGVIVLNQELKLLFSGFSISPMQFTQGLIFFVGTGYVYYFHIFNNQKKIFVTAEVKKGNEALYLKPLKEYMNINIIPRLLEQKFETASLNQQNYIQLDSRYLSKRQENGTYEPLLKTYNGDFHTKLSMYGFQGDMYLEDCFEITHDNNHFQFMEAFYINDPVGNNAERVPYGNFVIVSTEVHGRFEGEHLINSKPMFREHQEKFETAELESVEFMKQFDILTNNQRELRMVMKTNVMMRLMDLVPIGSKCFLEFKNQKVYIGIETVSGIFEPTLEVENNPQIFLNSLNLVEKMVNLTKDLAINYKTKFEH
jgi:Protein of unknown function (DUF3137)